MPAIKKRSLTLKTSSFSMNGVTLFPTSFTFDIDDNEQIQSLIGGTISTTNGDATRNWTAEIPWTKEDYTNIIALFNIAGTFPTTMTTETDGGIRNISLTDCSIPKKSANFPADGMSNISVSGTFSEFQAS